MSKWLVGAAIVLFLVQLGLAHAQPQTQTQSLSVARNLAKSSFFDLSAKSIAGKEVSFETYRGKVLLLVNVASKCGFTPQYEGLEALYNKYHEQGFEILGFPSNDFHAQEPGTNSEIQNFCKLNYGVTFPLFEKNAVLGVGKQPVYEYLVAHSPVEPNSEIGWNFEKFLVSPKGDIVGRWRSKIAPQDPALAKAIEAALQSSGQSAKK